MNLELPLSQKPYYNFFNKYVKIFETADQNGIKDDFTKLWSFYISSVIPSGGWKALWKPRKSSCFSHDLHFFSSFIVEVKKVNYDSLSTDIIITEDERNREFDYSKEIISSVPLQDLYIVQDEEHSELSSESAAECLDAFRLFYNYLWWPWEADEDYTLMDWLSKNLETRLRLYFDILGGIYCSDTIKALILKGKYIYEQILYMSEFCMENDEDIFMKYDLTYYMKIMEFVKMKLKRFICTSQLELLGLSFLRSKPDNGAYVVMPSPNTDQMSQCLKLIAQKYPNIILKKVVNDFKTISMEYNSFNMIFLSSGQHQFPSECFIIDVTIDCPFAEKAVIKVPSINWYFLKTTADNFTLNNIDILIDKNSVAIYVKHGITYLNSVTMKNVISESRRINAIIVGENGTLIANNCQFYDFNVAITCLPGAAVELTNCSFHGNTTDILAVNDIQLLLNNVASSNYKRAFIRYEGEFPNKGTCSIESFANRNGMSFNSLTIDNAEKAVELT